MTLNPNMMQWVSMLIYDELQKNCGMLSLNGEDRKIYTICMEDFRNYIAYLDRHHPIESKPQASQPSNEVSFITEERANNIIDEFLTIMITNRLYGLHTDLENTREITEFVHSWVKVWFKKWQQRTKIVFKEIPKMLNGDLPLNSNQFSKEEYDDLKQAVTDKLIQYGEICCSDILADALLKKDIQASQKKEWSMQDKLNLIPRVQREAREMSYTHGPLVFIRPNKGYGLREWRDDNASQIM